VETCSEPRTAHISLTAEGYTRAVCQEFDFVSMVVMQWRRI